MIIMMDKYVDKMRRAISPQKIKEALRAPSVKTASVQVVSYSAATTTGEEIARRFKTQMLPQITNLTSETESFYNMYTSAHDDESGAEKQKKELKPVEDLYNALMKAQEVILRFIAKRKKELTESVEAASPDISMDDADGDLGGAERLVAIIQELAGRNDLARILEQLEDMDHIADELENAKNTYESSLEHDTERKEY